MRKVRPRLVGLLVTTTACAAVVGCGSGDATSTGTAGGDAARTVGYMTGVQGDAFFATTVCGAEDAAKRYGLKLSVQVPPQFSVQASTPILQSFVTRKVDGLIAYPVDPVGVTPLFKQAQDKGIKTYTLSADLEDKSARSRNIGQDLFEGGVTAGRNLAEALGGEGSVFVVSVAPDLGPAVDRTNGFKQGIEGSPGIRYLGVQYSNNDEATAANVTAAQLKAHPEITGIYAVNHQSGVGAVNAVKQAGLSGKVKIVMHDTDPVEVEALERGEVIGLIGTNAYQFGYQAVKVMAADFDGDPDAEAEIPPERYITKDDLADPDVQREYIYKTSCGGGQG